MSSLDRKADLYLEVCQEFLIKEYGEKALLHRVPGSTFMTARSVAPQDGSEIRCFDVWDKAWETMEDFETNINIVHDGKIFVSYPLQDVDHGGMTFTVGHPREVAEVFQLLVNPASCIDSATDPTWEHRKLGDLADLYMVIPDGETWRLIDMANPPAGNPLHCLDALFYNVVQNWDKLCLGGTVEAYKLAERWPEAIKSLPLADSQLKAGYLVSPEAAVRSAIDCTAAGANPTQLFIQLLLVPKNLEVSSMYLREFLGRDKRTGKAIRNAFSEATTLKTLHDGLAGIQLFLPAKYHDQIRIASEHILLRGWLSEVADSLAHQRDHYSLQADTHWHLAHMLGKMVEENDT